MKSLLVKMQELHASRLASKLEKQKGASMLEYAILVGVVVVAAVAFSGEISGWFDSVTKKAGTAIDEALED